MPPMLGNLIKNFPEWGEHSNGMAQYIGRTVSHRSIPLHALLSSPSHCRTQTADPLVAWTALTSAGLGCSLQHYQKYIGHALNDTWSLPESWVCKAQLVFGTPDGPPRGGVEKNFADIEDRVRVFGGE